MLPMLRGVGCAMSSIMRMSARPVSVWSGYRVTTAVRAMPRAAAMPKPFELVPKRWHSRSSCPTLDCEAKTYRSRKFSSGLALACGLAVATAVTVYKAKTDHIERFVDEDREVKKLYNIIKTSFLTTKYKIKWIITILDALPEVNKMLVIRKLAHDPEIREKLGFLMVYESVNLHTGFLQYRFFDPFAGNSSLRGKGAVLLIQEILKNELGLTPASKAEGFDRIYCIDPMILYFSEEKEDTKLLIKSLVENQMMKEIFRNFEKVGNSDKLLFHVLGTPEGLEFLKSQFAEYLRGREKAPPKILESLAVAINERACLADEDDRMKCFYLGFPCLEIEECIRKIYWDEFFTIPGFKEWWNRIYG